MCSKNSPESARKAVIDSQCKSGRLNPGKYGAKDRWGSSVGECELFYPDVKSQKAV
jgi:hypothetical protein